MEVHVTAVIPDVIHPQEDFVLLKLLVMPLLFPGIERCW